VAELSTDLRRQVYERAKGCCEYCLLAEAEAFHAHHLDHIIPRQHGGQDSFDNLALCCVICNHFKGPNLASLDPATGLLTAFFHPRKHVWREHFILLDGFIKGRTPEGRATEKILRFNDDDRLVARQNLMRQGRYP
jgi:hypothetical protein